MAQSTPPYLEPAYEWLLEHLWNPYPKAETKQIIADKLGCPVKRVSEWFIDVRRRIGWTRFLREQFDGRRADMVDVAERHFFPRSGPPLPLDIHARFSEIEATAHEIYGHKVIPSALPNSVVVADKCLTPELQEQARLEDARAASIYPSPAPSDSSSPISNPGAPNFVAGGERATFDVFDASSEAVYSSDSSLVPPEASEATPATIALADWFSSDRTGDTVPGSIMFFDHAAPQTDISGLTPKIFSKSYPSPAASGLSSPISFRVDEGSSVSVSATSSSAPSTRKRRLSESDASGPSKRPRRNVSDPIPATVTLSGTPELLTDWFSHNHTGDTDLFKPGSLLDITFCDPADYFPENGEAPAATESITQRTSLQAPTEPDMISFDIPGLTPEIQQFFDPSCSANPDLTFTSYAPFRHWSHYI